MADVFVMKIDDGLDKLPYDLFYLFLIFDFAAFEAILFFQVFQNLQKTN